MNYKIVNRVPERKNCYSHNLKALLNEFARLDARCIEIDPVKEGYVNERSFQVSVSNAMRRYGYKGKMRTIRIGSKVYLIKIDILEGGR